MREMLTTPVFAVAVTFAVYYGALSVYKRWQWFLLNPVLLSIAGLIALLKGLHIEFQTYFQGGKIISFFLGPAVVALGVPLYLQLERIKRQKRAILCSIGAASVVGVLSAAGTALWLGGSHRIVASIAPKSVTTPIAMGIAEKLGGIPSLTAGLVIAAGVFGAVLGPPFLRLLRIRSATAFGLAMGAASHGIGTARALEEGELEGAAGGLAICLNGLATAVLAPLLLKFLYLIFPG